MRHAEHTAKSTSKTPSHRTGNFASRSSLLRGTGSGASPGRLLAVLALAITAFALTAATA